MEACNLFLSTHIPSISSKSLRIPDIVPVQARSLRFRIRASNLGGQSDVYGSGGGVYTPLQVRSPAGKYLSTLLQDKSHEFFESAVKGQLIRLSEAQKRNMQIMNLTDTNSDEAKLCKSVTEGLKKEIELEVEEIMYMLICRRFFEIGVHMLPRISDCMVERKLELSTSKDCQLEYIHTPEVLEFVKQFITCVTELNADSSVKDHWKLTQTDHCYLTMIYTSALLRGRFLKSVSHRYALEHLFNDTQTYQKSFKSYELEFPPDLRYKYSVPKSIEAKNMVTKHLKALFSQVKTSLASTKGRITTSSGTFRRLALEGFAFGTFLWDTDYFVSKYYMLHDDDQNLLPIF